MAIQVSLKQFQNAEMINMVDLDFYACVSTLRLCIKMSRNSTTKHFS